MFEYNKQLQQNSTKRVVQKMSKQNNKKAPYYLDAYQATPSPKVMAAPHDFNEVRKQFQQTVRDSTQGYSQDSLFLFFRLISYLQIKTPHNLPFMIQFQGMHSPYIKQLEKNPQIQFYDFTLEGPQESDFQQDQECKYLNDDVIIQEDAQHDEQIEDEVYVEPSTLNLKTFRAILDEFRNLKLTDEEVRQFVEEYLTDEDLEEAQAKTTEQLILIAEHNLRPCGVISWLERRNKVNKYLQKKKRRIWNKKINYDCRKKVAQNRLRIKGKFVTQEQARQMLGIREKSSFEQIKGLLERKYH